MPPQRQVSPERKKLYYIGMAVTVIGVLCFISVFISGALHFGDFSNFEQRGRSEATRAVLGMVMMIAGGFLTHIGRMGIAGSGIKLDPEEARRDVEPWARMTGGVVKDAMDEAGVKLGSQSSAEELPFDERLRRLQKLRQDGLVSEQEYETTKKKILESA
ncbi:MAG: SHOCT domain-containing protein [Verrucomicrobiota bacterium]